MTRASAAPQPEEPPGEGAAIPRHHGAAVSLPQLVPAQIPRRRRGRHPLGSSQSARIRSASLSALLHALAPNRGPVVTFSVRAKDGTIRRARFSHSSVLFALRRALAEAQATNASRAEPQAPARESTPAPAHHLAASA